MDRIIKCLIGAAIALTMSACVNAANEPELETVKAAAVKRFEGREVASVRTTPIKGIYEVVIKPRQILYADAKMNYMIVGDMLDLNKRVSLTDARTQELMHTDFGSLPFDQSFKIVRGDGSRKVAIFSDPDCPFCMKIERETLKNMNNVTIYTFLLPLTELHADAARKASLIWCSDNKPASWQAWMYEGKLPNNDGKCATPIKTISALADQLDIHGTPTMVFENGDISAGAMDPATFEAKLVAKRAK